MATRREEMYQIANELVTALGFQRIRSKSTIIIDVNTPDFAVKFKQLQTALTAREMAWKADGRGQGWLYSIDPWDIKWKNTGRNAPSTPIWGTEKGWTIVF